MGRRASIASASLFHGVSRYVPNAKFDPRENRLTEVTAAVLERVKPVAIDLCRYLAAEACAQGVTEGPAAVASLTGAAPPGLRVRTQQGTRSGGFVDLELRTAVRWPARGRGLLLWAEIKHGAGIHYATDPRSGRARTQLEAYLEDIGSVAPGARLIMVIAPRQSMPALTPAGVATVTWQQLARRIGQWREDRTLSESQRFLVDEYCRYLREEKLMDADEPLTVEHAAALAVQPRAHEVVEGLEKLAREAVLEAWGPPQGRYLEYDPSPGVAPTSPSRWGTATFEWGLGSDDERGDRSRGAQAFSAGASMVDMQTPSDWLALCLSKGFEHVPIDKPTNYHDRIRRYLYPEQLLLKESLHEQARLLADFVIESFRMLAEDAPPVATDEDALGS